MAAPRPTEPSRTVPNQGTSAADAAYRRAWLSLLLFVPAFAGAFLVGEGLADLLGPDLQPDEVQPLWIAVLAGGPALLVFCLPAVLAWRYSRRAAGLGRQSAPVPGIVGITLAGAFVAQNLVSYVLVSVFG